MTAIASNYVSPEALTLWLSEKQNEIYGDMRNAIDMSNERSQMQSDLGDIQKALTDAHASGNFQQVSGDIAAFLVKYENNPDLAEVSKPLVEIKQTVDKFYGDAASAIAIQIYGAEQMGNTAEVQRLKNLPPPQLIYNQAVIDNWSDAIESKTNFLGQQDQLAMIQIQELNGKVNQSEQLVSNLIASQNQTQNAVISNIRG